MAAKKTTGRIVVKATRHVAAKQPGSKQPASGVRDRSSAATGTSIFDKADASRRKLGKRDST